LVDLNKVINIIMSSCPINHEVKKKIMNCLSLYFKMEDINLVGSI